MSGLPLGRRSGSLLFLAAVLLAWGCSSSTISGAKPLSLELTSDRTSTVVGQPVEFRWQATGSSLSGVILDYGDGVIDSIPAYGSQSSSGLRTHAYEMGGRFQVTGRVEDADLGRLTRTLVVDVSVR